MDSRVCCSMEYSLKTHLKIKSRRIMMTLDCFTSHVDEHRTVRGLWKRQGIPCFFKIPTVQQSAETEMPFVYVTLATHVTLATAGYTPCLFVYVTIGLGRHNRTHVSQSGRLLVKPQRPWTDLCAERVGLWSRLWWRHQMVTFSAFSKI